MFKSLFSKKNRKDSLEARNEDENNESSSDSAQQPGQQPVNEVLNQLYETLDPSDSKGYAVAVAEAEYLWARYQQLIVRGQAVNDDILLQEPFKSKPFLRQVWNTIPRDSSGNLTFSALFGVLKWWESVDQETKLRGIFRLLNTGQPLDIVAIRHIIKAMDESLSEDSINRKAELLMTHLDDSNQGHVDEEQWVSGIKAILSDEEISQLTSVYILPPSSTQQIPHTQRSFGSNSHGSPIPEEMLIRISSKIGEHNWKQLAQELGFTDKDVKALEKHFPNRSREQVYQMLKHWREKEGSTKQALEFALRRCRMDEVLSVLQNESGEQLSNSEQVT